MYIISILVIARFMGCYKYNLHPQKVHDIRRQRGSTWNHITNTSSKFFLYFVEYQLVPHRRWIRAWKSETHMWLKEERTYYSFLSIPISGLCHNGQVQKAVRPLDFVAKHRQLFSFLIVSTIECRNGYFIQPRHLQVP